MEDTDIIQQIVAFLEDRKAEDIVTLDLREHANIAARTNTLDGCLYFIRVMGIVIYVHDAAVRHGYIFTNLESPADSSELGKRGLNCITADTKLPCNSDRRGGI